jgi:integrase
MARREEVLLPGLYKNGPRVWVRTVRAPLSGVVKPLSTGTSETGRANAVKRLVATFATNPTQYDWLERAVRGDVSLDQLYTHHAAGSLHELRAQLDARSAADADPDLEPLAGRWASEAVARRSLADETKRDYERQLRLLIPAGAPFPSSRFTSDTLSAALDKVPGTDSTKRHYVAAWRLFYKWVRPRVPALPNPFEDESWLPDVGKPRSMTWDFETVQTVLEHVAPLSEPARVALALVFGTGIELGALLAMRREHIGTFQSRIDDDERTIVAPGTKNRAREDRTIFVDKWAWKLLRPYATPFTPRAPLWPWLAESDGKELREGLFYPAQVAAGVLEKPPTSERTGKKQWGQAKPHTLHDARHTYCEIRGLGLDGEAPQDITFLSHQLGHADEQMVMRIYKKKNIKERLRLLRMQRDQQAARAAGAQ